jgi:prolyl-tRNA synthetase
MRQSEYFIKTSKTIAAEETSDNAQLLLRGGFVDKMMAGVYSYLPLGLRVLQKIKQVVREEMETIGGQEILMPALQPRQLWEETERWEGMKDVLYRFSGRGGNEFCLAPTHEEAVVDIARKRLQSYKDLPCALFQIQDKFRNEPRAKSGLLRGREFSMKDLYSFHASKEDLNTYYDSAIQTYLRLFRRLGMEAILVEASGGSFSKDFSHEFQVPTPNGEDSVFYCQCGWAQNKEIAKFKKGDKCPRCGEEITILKGIEVGNIFKLGTKYSQAMNLSFVDQAGKKNFVEMGCYGIGVSRVMGAIVEVSHDENGIIWPAEVTPWQVHLLVLGANSQVKAEAEAVYDLLTKQGFEVLFDDRDESSGIKLKEADLIGISVRLIISEQNNGLVEFKPRGSETVKKVAAGDLVKLLEDFYNV